MAAHNYTHKIIMYTQISVPTRVLTDVGMRATDWGNTNLQITSR